MDAEELYLTSKADQGFIRHILGRLSPRAQQSHVIIDFSCSQILMGSEPMTAAPINILCFCSFVQRKLRKFPEVLWNQIWSFFYVLTMFKRLNDWFWCCCTFQRNWSVRIWIWQKVVIFSYCVFRQIELPIVKMTTSWRREIIFSFHIRFWQNRQRSGSLLLLLFLPDRTFSLKGCSLKIRARVGLIRISAEKNWTSQSFLVWTMERPL